MITSGRPIKRDMTTHLGVELDEFMVELEICGLSIGCWLVSSQLSSSSSVYKLINPSPDISVKRVFLASLKKFSSGNTPFKL